jgi:hypothetical protein
MNQITTTQNLRDQLVNQIYIITNIQKAINDNSIDQQLDIFLSKYNDSISNINSFITLRKDKLDYFDIKKEQSIYNKQQFTKNLAKKCKNIESIFDKVASLNYQAIQGSKNYVKHNQTTNMPDKLNISNINNAILANNI